MAYPLCHSGRHIRHSSLLEYPYICNIRDDQWVLSSRYINGFLWSKEYCLKYLEMSPSRTLFQMIIANTFDRVSEGYFDGFDSAGYEFVLSSLLTSDLLRFTWRTTINHVVEILTIVALYQMKSLQIRQFYVILFSISKVAIARRSGSRCVEAFSVLQLWYSRLLIGWNLRCILVSQKNIRIVRVIAIWLFRCRCLFWRSSSASESLACHRNINILPLWVLIIVQTRRG